MTRSNFVERVKELATNLEAVGHKPEDSEVSLSVLAGRPEEYKVLVTISGTDTQTQTLDQLSAVHAANRAANQRR